MAINHREKISLLLATYVKYDKLLNHKASFGGDVTLKQLFPGGHFLSADVPA